MNLSIECNGQELHIKITDNSPETEFKYNMDSVVDLDEFILQISDSDSVVKCSPENYNEFAIANNDLSVELLKLSEYIYKIVGEFNISYNEIFPLELPDEPPSD